MPGNFDTFLLTSASKSRIVTILFFVLSVKYVHDLSSSIKSTLLIIILSIFFGEDGNAVHAVHVLKSKWLQQS